MGIPNYIIRMFGGEDRVPGYIKRHFARRAQRREDAARKERERKERERQEHERIKALRRPPQNVRLHSLYGGRGAKVTWEPPATADQLKPAGYWVSEKRNGSWTKHGDYVLPGVREVILFGTGPASVETWYHQMALGEFYSAPAILVAKDSAPAAPAPAAPGNTEEADSPDRDLIQTVRSYLTATGRPRGYYDRWRRVLAGLGAESHPKPMTAAEAQSYVDKGWGDRWPPVVAALRRREAERG